MPSTHSALGPPPRSSPWIDFLAIVMGILSFFRQSYRVSAFFEENPRNPQDKLGDPITRLTPENVDRDYRSRINRGELAMPTWALHEALRLTPILGNYARLWVDSITGFDWTIKQVPDPERKPGQQETPHDLRAKQQATALKARYEMLNVNEAVEHLALGNLFGFSALAKHPGKLEPINWWNMARVGLFGPWFYNPRLRVQDGRNLPHEDQVDRSKFIIREVGNGCLLEYLRLFLRIKDVEAWWDDNLEKESRRQVAIVVPGSVTDADTMEVLKSAAQNLSRAKSGIVSGGSSRDDAPSVIFPPESRGLPFYENRIKLLDEWACKALFGAPLIANSAPDSGTLAGNAHSDTSKRRIYGAAAHISSTMQQQFDIEVLREAGLLSPGETPLAYFDLIDRETIDPGKEIEWTTLLKQGGFDRDPAELSERTGMTLTKSAAAPAHGPLPFFNRHCGDLLNRAADEVGVPPEWLQPVRDLLNEIAEKAEDKKLSEQELAAYVKAAALRVPELFGEMDVEAFAKMLEGIMGAAAVEGVRDALRR